MGISTIPDPDFVFCRDCKFNKKVKVFPPRKKSTTMKSYCHLSDPPRLLRGQRGCTSGARKQK